jgi:hypothetical protein
MKMKCENIVSCGNYNCELNYDGACIRTVVALNGDGKCVMCKPKARLISNDGGKPAQNKSDMTHGVLDY